MIGFINGLMVTVVGIAFPAYASFKAIETDSKDDDTQWLIYWVIFACFQLLEALTDVFVSWFPFYYEVRFFSSSLVPFFYFFLASSASLCWPFSRFRRGLTRVDIGWGLFPLINS
jgi:TB2/DP1, HVA22 family